MYLPLLEVQTPTCGCHPIFSNANAQHARVLCTSLYHFVPPMMRGTNPHLWMPSHFYQYSAWGALSHFVPPCTAHDARYKPPLVAPVPFLPTDLHSSPSILYLSDRGNIILLISGHERYKTPHRPLGSPVPPRQGLIRAPFPSIIVQLLSRGQGHSPWPSARCKCGLARGPRGSEPGDPESHKSAQSATSLPFGHGGTRIGTRCPPSGPSVCRRRERSGCESQSRPYGPSHE